MADDLNNLIARMFSGTSPEFVKDVLALIELDRPSRTRLHAALSNYEPPSQAITLDDWTNLAHTANVTPASAHAILHVATRVVGEQDRELMLAELRDAPEMVERVESLRSVLEEFEDVLVTLRNRYARLRRLGRAMPSFLRCDVECDLRYVAGSAEDEYELLPAALIRFGLDEPRDRPFVFQCSEPALQRIIEKLQDAQLRMQRLRRFSETRSQD